MIMTANSRSTSKLDIDISAFFNKLKSVKGESKLILKALTLFYILCDADVPVWVKAICTSALIYFINPWDPLGPDPFVFANDIAILAAALSSLSNYIKSTHTQQAKQQLKQI